MKTNQIKSFTQLVNAIGNDKSKSAAFHSYAIGAYHTEAQAAAEDALDDFDISDEKWQQHVSELVWEMLIEDVTETSAYSDYIDEFGLQNTIAAGLVAAGQCDKDSAVWLVNEYVGDTVFA